MAKKLKKGSVKRFGARYGRRVKEKLAMIEELAKASYKCPYCHHKKAKKLSVGIFFCSKCNTKFTAKAYHISKATLKKEDSIPSYLESYGEEPEERAEDKDGEKEETTEEKAENNSDEDKESTADAEDSKEKSNIPNKEETE